MRSVPMKNDLRKSELRKKMKKTATRRLIDEAGEYSGTLLLENHFR
jgi:hypothetical protein